MKQKQALITIALTAAIFAIAACAAVPFLASQSLPTNQSVAEIFHCKANPTSLCLDSFGIDNTSNMLISFFVPPGSTSDFYLKVQNNDETSVYQCQVAKNFTSTVYCTGKQIPLGTSINIELFSNQGNILLAKGTFIINAIALPTQIIVVATIGTNEISTPITSIPTKVITVTPPSQITKTPTSINPYPNPYPNP